MLSSYCSLWILSINPKLNQKLWSFRNAQRNVPSLVSTLIIVQNYAYLGTLISSTGIFSVALDQLKEKALHALFILRKHTNISKLSPFLASKFFLTYNSEVWDVYAKPDFKSWDNWQIKKVHLQFCKRYLELRRFPLIVAINQKIINCTLYLQNKENDSVVRQILSKSADIHSSGKNSLYSTLIRLSEFYNLPDFDPIFLTDAKIKHYVINLMQENI